VKRNQKYFEEIYSVLHTKTEENPIKAFQWISIMKKLLLRIPERMLSDLKRMSAREKRPVAVIIREAIERFLRECRAQDALDWFVNTHCKKCNNNCKVGSLKMIECMLKKMDEKGRGGIC